MVVFRLRLAFMGCLWNTAFLLFDGVHSALDKV